MLNPLTSWVALQLEPNATDSGLSVSSFQKYYYYHITITIIAYNFCSFYSSIPMCYNILANVNIHNSCQSAYTLANMLGTSSKPNHLFQELSTLVSLSFFYLETQIADDYLYFSLDSEKLGYLILLLAFGVQKLTGLLNIVLGFKIILLISCSSHVIFILQFKQRSPMLFPLGSIYHHEQIFIEILLSSTF